MEEQIIFKKELQPLGFWWHVWVIATFAWLLYLIYPIFYPPYNNEDDTNLFYWVIFCFSPTLYILTEHFSFSTTEIDNQAGRVLIRKKSLWRRTLKEYSFDEIDRFKAAQTNYQDAQKNWMVSMNLKSGKEIALPGTIKTEENAAEELAGRLTDYLYIQLKAGGAGAKKLRP